LVRRLRADEVINFREEKIEAYVERLTSGSGFDVVFDTVGGKNLIASMDAARTNGRLVTTNAPVTVDLTTAHSKALSLHGVFMMLPLITASDEKAMENVCDTLHSSLTVTACIPCCVAMTRSSSSAFAMKNMAFLPLSPRAS
jgi:NADPH2:quinone reductase